MGYRSLSAMQVSFPLGLIPRGRVTVVNKVDQFEVVLAFSILTSVVLLCKPPLPPAVE